MILLFLATLGYIGSRDELELVREKRIGEADARSRTRYRRTLSIVWLGSVRHSHGVSYLVLHGTAHEKA